MQLLLRAVNFNNTSDNPPAQARNVSFSVTDADNDTTQAQMAVDRRAGINVSFLSIGPCATMRALIGQLPPGTEVVMLDRRRGWHRTDFRLVERPHRRPVDPHRIERRAGEVHLGSGSLSLATLSSYAGQIGGWSSSLTSTADILFYGCDVASNAGGQSLVQQLATLTGADVAASTDKTGSSALGGDWILEHQAGVIQTQTAFSSSTAY